MDRFLKENPDLIARTLNDTRYLSRAAKAYLQAVCPKVEPIRGAMTSSLRHFWGLNKILGDSEKKDRNEHRHHAIDAFVVAASSRFFLWEFQKRTEENKVQSPSKNPLRLKQFPDPYFGFTPKVIEEKVSTLLVSHRQNQLKPKTIGEKANNTPSALHKETFYGIEEETETNFILKVRKPITSLKAQDCKNIASPRMRRYFTDQTNIFQSEREWNDFLKDLLESGRIRRIRMLEKTSKDTVTAFKGRDGKDYRYAKTGGNAWADIIETIDKKGKTKWISIVTTLFEAATLMAKEPIWKKNYPAARLVCRLAINDTVALLGKDKKWRLFRVKKLSRDDGRVCVRDLRIANESQDKMSIRLSASRMLQENLTKVAIGPTGDLRAPSHIRQNLYVGPIYTDTK